LASTSHLKVKSRVSFDARDFSFSDFKIVIIYK
jgi:hypothetical protein